MPVSTRISVSVHGRVGLDEPEHLRKDLEATTGLTWRQRPGAEPDTLSGGWSEVLLDAAIATAVQMTAQAAVDAAKQVLRRWSEQRLDPPETSVVVHDDADSAGPDQPRPATRSRD